ncbi:MAG TPA: hypothetical protein VF523_00245 [Burkholderiales bacterium]
MSSINWSGVKVGTLGARDAHRYTGLMVNVVRLDVRRVGRWGT